MPLIPNSVAATYLQVPSAKMPWLPQLPSVFPEQDFHLMASDVDARGDKWLSSQLLSTVNETRAVTFFEFDDQISTLLG